MKIALYLAMILGLAVSATAAENNLIQNGGFEMADQDGAPSGWYQQSFSPEMNIAVTSEKTHSGKWALRIDNIKDNDVRLFQMVKVAPNCCYCLSGWIATRSIPDHKIGANFSIITSADHSEAITGTQDWSFVTYYFKTNAKQNGLSVGVRLGNWGSTVTGTAYFDDLRLEQVDDIPAVAPVLTDNSNMLYEKQRVKKQRADTVKLFILWGVGVMVIGGIGYFGIRKRRAKR